MIPGFAVAAKTGAGSSRGRSARLDGPMNPGQNFARVAARDIAPAIEWATSPSPVDYPAAVRAMEARAEADCRGGCEPELVWLLEHPPIYTAGTSAREGSCSILSLPRASDRPRRALHLSWSGPADRLRDARRQAPRRRRARLRGRARATGSSRTLADLGVAGETREGRVGVWVRRPDKGRGRRGQDRRHRTAGDASG